MNPPTIDNILAQCPVHVDLFDMMKEQLRIIPAVSTWDPSSPIAIAAVTAWIGNAGMMTTAKHSEFVAALEEARMAVNASHVAPKHQVALCAAIESSRS